jgi:transposase
MPAAVVPVGCDEGDGMVNVMIGIDPHKASHTAAAIDPAENGLGQLRVRATAGQVEKLLSWAEGWPERTWAVENAGGLGYLLSQQLLAAGEKVLDVPPKLAARVRLLNSGDVNKNDPNDARSVAIAALRSPAVKAVAVEDHQAIMKLWAKRHRDLGRARTQLVCRLHALLCELVPGGGISKELSVAKASKVLAGIDAEGAVAAARYALAEAFIDDLRRIDDQLRDTKKRITAAVTASETTVTDIFGAGPVVAAMVKGDVGDVRRFASRDRFAAYNGTAPIEVSSGEKKIYRLSRRGNRRLNHAIHIVAVTQLRFAGTDGRAYFERKRAEGKTGKEALRSLKRRISDLLYARLLEDARRDDARQEGPGGQTGNDSHSSAAGSHPEKPALRKSHSRTQPKTTTSRPSTRPRTPPATRTISRRAS